MPFFLVRECLFFVWICNQAEIVIWTMQKDDQLLSLSQKKGFSMWLKKIKFSQHLRLLLLTDKLTLKPWQLWNKASYFQLFSLQSCTRTQLPLLMWLVGVYIKSHKNWHDKKWILCIYFCCHWEANTAKMSETLLPIFLYAPVEIFAICFLATSVQSYWRQGLLSRLIQLSYGIYKKVSKDFGQCVGRYN